jgi:hypothetical protein
MQDLVQYNYHTYLVDETLSSYHKFREEALGIYCLLLPIFTLLLLLLLLSKNYIYATVQHNYLLKQYYNIKGGNMFRLTSSCHHQTYHNTLTSV